MAMRRARSLNDRRSTAAGARPRPLVRQTADGFLRVGYIAGSHGLHGALRVRTDNPDSTTLGALERLLVATARGGGHQRVFLGAVEDVDAAQALRGGAVMVAAASLPPLKEGEFYYFQIAGAEVILTDGRPLGIIEDIMSTAGHDVWVVRDGEREVLVPVIADVVKAMDLE